MPSAGQGLEVGLGDGRILAGSLRKYEAQTKNQRRLTKPRITEETRQGTNAGRPAISGGVTALPICAKEWVMP
jgi:hypothetical protein